MAFREFKLVHRLEYFLEICLHVLHYYKNIVHFPVWRANYVIYLGGELIIGHLGELSKDLDLSYYFFRVVTVLHYAIN